MSILTLETNKYALKLENFEGPLDLLIHLIDKNKMDIQDVKLSEIEDQYIEYINEMEKQNLDITSEFLVIASTLVYIKSKELLTKENEDESESIPSPFDFTKANEYRPNNQPCSDDELSESFSQVKQNKKNRKGKK